jgi:dienelactone hydrolase
MNRLVPLLVVTASLGAACSSDDASSTTNLASDTTDVTADVTAEGTTEPTTPVTAAPTTESSPTTDPSDDAPTAEVTAEQLATRGPFAVGVTTRTLPEGGLVEIWYPAAAAGGSDTYAVRSFLPEGVAALIGPGIDDTLTIEATRDATPSADGPFPIVLFSHGASSFRLQSSLLAEHLASWGMVTASTDHPSRDLSNSLGGTSEGRPPAVDQMRAMRTMLTTLDGDPVLAGALDTDRVALGGHSAGGGTIVEVAADPGILGYVSYASGLRDAAPDVPSLFMAGELDTIVPAAERTVPAFEAAPAPSWLWLFDGAGHLAFSDLCVIGGDANLVDLAVAAGIGDFVPEQLRSLATDGCEEPNRPVEDVFPGVYQASTGFYRWVFGLDPEPIGLDASVVTDGVTVTAK